jgi:hypothetical protein
LVRIVNTKLANGALDCSIRIGCLKHANFARGISDNSNYAPAGRSFGDLRPMGRI